MPENVLWVFGAMIVLLIVVAALYFYKKRGPSIPQGLRPGKPLPDFSAIDEQGNPVRSDQLKGTPTAMLFVRGNWCPFCTRQVRELTRYYKEIAELGAKLIFVAPEPLDTTRRVGAFFDVKFDFWLDENLHIAKQLGLLLAAGVPADHLEEYGEDTVWPTSLVIDAQGVIRYAKLSRYIIDRPDPKVLLSELRKLQE